MLATLTILPTILSSCGRVVEKCPGYNITDSANTISKDGSIRVSIDASGSMKGFTVFSDLEYAAVMEEMNSLLSVQGALGMTKSKTELIRLGRKTNGNISMMKMSSLLAAKLPEFYVGNGSNWPAVSSSIDQFTTSESDSTDILVTDLEPDNASIEKLISSVKQKLISGEHQHNPTELIMVGIKSRFSGGVFPSVANEFEPFYFNGVRPFYVLVLGETHKAEKIVSQLLRIPILKGKVQLTRFASNPNHGYTAFASTQDVLLEPANCLRGSFSVSQGFLGKVNFDHEDRWILARAARICKENRPYSLTINKSSKIGFTLNQTTKSNILESVFGKLSGVTSYGIRDDKYSLTLEPKLHTAALNQIHVTIENSELDPLIWRDWSSEGTASLGARTQRLTQLIRRIRDETDNYAISRHQQKYSPLRICGLIKS